MKIYGLKNCDTCRKALKWLESRSMEHEFVDVRADGVPIENLRRWVDELGWEVVLNRRSTTWRELDQADKEDLDNDKAVTLMAAHPTLIKRPVFEAESGIFIGFQAATQNALEGL